MTDSGFTHQPEGATPIDDVSGLKQPQIRSLAELNEAEALNLVAAIEWIENGRIGDPFSVDFYVALHQRMLEDVWDWAGNIRATDLNIGVPHYDVRAQLQTAALDFKTQYEAKGVPFLEFIAAYHHRLVWIHPFKNGNGRWARLACDAVAVRLRKEQPIVWASRDLVAASEERSRYIAALRAADQHDPRPLIEYLTDHNADHR